MTTVVDSQTTVTVPNLPQILPCQLFQSAGLFQHLPPPVPAARQYRPTRPCHFLGTNETHKLAASSQKLALAVRPLSNQLTEYRVSQINRTRRLGLWLDFQLKNVARPQQLGPDSQILTSQCKLACLAEQFARIPHNYPWNHERTPRLAFLHLQSERDKDNH